DLNVPTEIKDAMDRGAALAVSISGGKDSQAMATALVAWAKREGYWGVNEMFAVHADLGRMEWSGEFATEPLVAAQAAALGLPFHVVTRTDGRDLVDHIKARREKLAGEDKPFWPGPGPLRYCTSDLKREPINKLLRNWAHVISAEGIRSEESKARAQKPCWQPRKRITTKSREAHTWNPIIDWTEDDVWAALGGRDGPLVHPAYGLGNERLSCALCIMGCDGDLVNGARNNPALFEELLEMERDSGWNFTQRRSLEEVKLCLDGKAELVDGKIQLPVLNQGV
ncbi:MAG: phosphoadenosine phosphosulfate reductase family protein, partial [Gemmatimonadetes bacterium]|nr:phosphoadenosine phosphosulfate reductase family protein [Gemmatimonadota bacterium]